MAGAERDARLVATLQRALRAMKLTHGSRIDMVGVSGILNFEKEILDVRGALILLAIDPDEVCYI